MYLKDINNLKAVLKQIEREYNDALIIYRKLWSNYKHYKYSIPARLETKIYKCEIEISYLTDQYKWLLKQLKELEYEYSKIKYEN